MENKPTHAVTLDIDLADHGYALVKADLENGFHPGQNDDPKKIYRTLREQGYQHLIFQVDACGQFDINFSVWSKAEDGE